MRAVLVVVAGLIALAGSPAAALFRAGPETHGGIAYLARWDSALGDIVERYELGSGRRLAPIPLTRWPSDISVGDSGLFAADSTGVTRYSLDGASRELVLSGSFSGLASDGVRLFAWSSAGIDVVDEETLELLHHETTSVALEDLQVAPASRRLIASTWPRRRLVAASYSASGEIGPMTESQEEVYGPRLWIWPDESRVVDRQGHIWSADELTWQSHFEGDVVDLAFWDDRIVVLRDEELALFGPDLQETGRLRFSFRADGLAVDGDRAVIFAEDHSGNLVATAVDLTQVGPVDPGPPLDAESTEFIPEAGVLDDSGVLHLLDRESQSLFRWSMDTRSYLPSIRLPDEPTQLAYTAAANRLLLGYRLLGVVRTLPLDGSTAEQPFVRVPWALAHLLGAGGLVLVSNDGSDPLRIYGSDGSLIDVTDRLAKDGLTWSEGSRTLYYTAGPSLRASAIDEDGALGPERSVPISYRYSYSSLGPWAAQDGSRVVTSSGEVFDGQTLAPVGEIGEIGEPILAAVWTAGRLYTLSNSGPTSALRAWRADLSLEATYPLPPPIYRGFLFVRGQQLLVVTFDSYAPRFSVLGVVDFDEDGFPNGEDAFPADPAEWSDLDGDGSGDNGDVFPDDPSEWLDSDGDGTGDNADDLPLDPTETSDRDGDGHGDNSDRFPDDRREWIDSDGDGLGDNHDVFPFDPAEMFDTDRDGVGNNADEFPFDATETRDFDQDGVGDNSDPFPIGEPFLGLRELHGMQRLSVAGLGSLRGPLAGDLGLLADGVFSLCAAGACVFGVHDVLDSAGRDFALYPDPAFLAEAEQALEEELRSGLSEVFGYGASADLTMKPQNFRCRLKLTRNGGRAKLRLRIEFDAALTGVPRRFRKLRVAWVWKLDTDQVAIH